MQKHPSSATVVLSLSASLLAAALAIVLHDSAMGDKSEKSASRTFQRSVRGLGIGSALRPDWGFATYDPRVDAEDETSLWPVPGGYSYSPQRGMMGDDAGQSGDISLFSRRR